MLAVIISVIAFFLTLPLKVTKLGLKTAIKARELGDKSGEDKKANKREKKRDSALQWIRNRRKSKTGTDKVLKGALRVVQVLTKLVFFIRVCAAVIAVILEVIMFILMNIVVLLMASSVIIVILLGGNLFSGKSWSSVVYGGGNTLLVGTSSNTVYASGNLMTALETVTKWYIAHVPTYQNKIQNTTAHTDSPSEEALAWRTEMVTIGGKTGEYQGFVQYSGGRAYYPCDLFGSFDDGFTVGDDCSGFVTAYIRWFLQDKTAVPDASTADMCGSGNWHNAMLQNGFICIEIDEAFSVSDLVPGDIMVAYKASGGTKTYGHAEVYVSSTETFGWGAARDSYWRKFSMRKVYTDGMYGLQMGTWYGVYHWIYRYAGGSNS